MTPQSLLLVTGASGLVGSHVCEQAREQGLSVRALVRRGSDRRFLDTLGIEIAEGELRSPESLTAAAKGVTHVVHCAARVGDWGPVAEYQRDNVDGVRNLLGAFRVNKRRPHFVHISSLGVYPARDHHQTDETTPVNTAGIDGYTRSKVETEQAVLDFLKAEGGTAVILRPGFIYGPRDRNVLPRLVERIRGGKFAFLGSGRQLMNNTYVGNLVDAAFLALDRPDLSGEAFNITDPRLVSKLEFVEGVCRAAGLSQPKKHAPLVVAKILASTLDSIWRTVGRQSPPPVSQAAVKFMGYNLDYSIAKARRLLKYDPQFDFTEAMALSLEAPATRAAA